MHNKTKEKKKKKKKMPRNNMSKFHSFLEIRSVHVSVGNRGKSRVIDSSVEVLDPGKLVDILAVRPLVTVLKVGKRF